MSLYRYAFVVCLVSVACGGKLDPNATERTATRQVGTGNGKVSSSSSSGDVSSSSSGGASTGPCNGSGLIPFDQDFEDGSIGDGFNVNSPSAFSIEWDEPINGSASLRVKPNPASFIERKLKGVCAARLQFTLRASSDFLKSGGTLARFDAGTLKVNLSVTPGGQLSIFEEVRSGQAAGGGGPPALGSLFADDPTTIVLDVDLSTLKLTVGFKSQKGSAPTIVEDLGVLAPMPAPSITSISIGTVPGIVSNPQGLYYLDDISID